MSLIAECIGCIEFAFTPSPECGIYCACVWCGLCCFEFIKDECRTKFMISKQCFKNCGRCSKRCFKDCGRCCDENYFNTCCLINDYSYPFRPSPHSCCCSQSLKENYINRETNKGFITRTPIKSCWNQTTGYMCGTPYEPPEKYKHLIEIEPNFYHECYKNSNRCCDENYYSACCCYQRLIEDNAIVKNNNVYIYSTPLKFCWNKMTCYMCGTPYKVISDPQKYKDLKEKSKNIDYGICESELIENHKKNGCNWDDLPINSVKK